ncbi:hypothetical protein BGW36DRAFT_398744 [Talaromyces proteolyticus]|uniref:Uncharacterized protein n=1 Tax=Talaromyces proteolyticus TaxID=1131652 RepID=A0AAD4PWW1_9EURO|nr:uncharacterized protein BGW36DRAFT_398744 [Talaromyces proteolyticus]KAH8695530.1 hypothetical protein BGW36DRAFT_398744 [Talaromyces proteolyticus]
MPTTSPSTAPLEGWQFDDNSRSSWDILWTCLSAILACTWTALHLSVPKNRQPEWRAFTQKVLIWLFVVVYPELTLVNEAVSQFFLAQKTLTNFESAQEEIDQGAVPPSSVLGEPEWSPESWSLTHAFCVNMRGLALQTKDKRTYVVESRHVRILLKAGIINYSLFDKRDIDDRSKVDSLAKVFSLIQSIYTTVNLLSRVAYHLPITPLEITTLAFLFCPFISYAFWWKKPKDMSAPILIHLPYNHDSDEMASELRDLLTDNREVSLRKELLGNLCVLLASLAFSAIHIAAWNSSFPTPAERLAWRVLSVISICLCLPMFLVMQMPFLRGWLASFQLPGLPSFDNPYPDETKPEIVVLVILLFTYALARIGTFVLMIMSLRALPAGSYVSIDWLKSIPHI